MDFSESSLGKDHQARVKLSMLPKRVVVIGTSCAGKSTFASRLASELGTKHLELDAFHWEPNWKEAEREVFRARVGAAVEADSWVVDGNYQSKIRDVVWNRADTVIWLDPPLGKILSRFFLRSFSRSVKRELLWGHSRENLRNSIFSRKSLLLWILSTHKKKCEEYARLIKNPPAGIQMFRLRSHKQIEKFFEHMASSR